MATIFGDHSYWPFSAIITATVVAEKNDYSVYSHPVWTRLNMFYDGPTEYESKIGSSVINN